MAMPADFRYRDVFLKGKPQHDRFDLFRIRHPSMDVGRRAKIFSPFDALKGFNEAIASKDPDDPEAFHAWLHDYSRGGGHPWEVCRGGNSTHVSLRPMQIDIHREKK